MSPDSLPRVKRIPRLRPEGLRRVLVVLPENPRRSDSGGRIESRAFWRTVSSVTAAECIAFAKSADLAPTPHDAVLVPRSRVRGLLGFVLGRPYQSASRHLPSDVLDWAQSCHREVPFSAVLAESANVLGASSLLARKLRVPVHLRQVNIEGDYYLSLADQESRLPLRAYYLLESRWFRRMEKTFATASTAYISEEDFIRARQLGLPDGLLIPPLSALWVSQPSGGATSERASSGSAVGFLASLGLPFNEAGLIWFLRNCWGDILANVPAAKVHVAGRGASSQLKRELDRHEGVRFWGPVPDSVRFRSEMDVLINPIRQASGAAIKVFESFSEATPLVSTSVGLRGVPLSLRSPLIECDDGPEFAEAVVRLLNEPACRMNVVAAQQRVFRACADETTSAIHAWLDDLCTTASGVAP